MAKSQGEFKALIHKPIIRRRRSPHKGPCGLVDWSPLHQLRSTAIGGGVGELQQWDDDKNLARILGGGGCYSGLSLSIGLLGEKHSLGPRKKGPRR